MKRLLVPEIDSADRNQLREIASDSETPARVSRRALILLAASDRAISVNAVDARQLTDHGIAARIGVCADTVRGVLRRYALDGLEAAVYDKPFVRKVTAEAEELLVDLVTSEPPTGSSRWTLELLAQTLSDRKIVESISDTGVWDILQKHGIRIERNGALSSVSSSRDKERAKSPHDRSEHN